MLIYLYNLGQMCGLNRKMTPCSYFLLLWIKLDIEEVCSLLAQSAILDVKYLPVPIVGYLFQFTALFLCFFLLPILTHSHLMKESFFSDIDNMLAQYTVGAVYLSQTNFSLFNSLSMYYAFAEYWIALFLPFFSSSFLHPILVCNRLRNLLPSCSQRIL